SPTPVVDSAEGHLLHVIHQACSQVAAIVPRANGRFGKDQLLIGALLTDIQELLAVATVVVVGCPRHHGRDGFIVVNLDGIIRLIGHVVVVVVVVEHVYFGAQTGTPQAGAKALFDESLLLLPSHKQGGRVAAVQRFVLRGHRVDGNAFSLQRLYPLYEIQAIVRIVVRVQVTAGPFVVRQAVGEII